MYAREGTPSGLYVDDAYTTTPPARTYVSARALPEPGRLGEVHRSRDSGLRFKQQRRLGKYQPASPPEPPESARRSAITCPDPRPPRAPHDTYGAHADPVRYSAGVWHPPVFHLGPHHEAGYTGTYTSRAARRPARPSPRACNTVRGLDAKVWASPSSPQQVLILNAASHVRWSGTR
ncbi:hypothetical protein BD413DRAFT_591206 [Trametes elegans]|nr:hypothetical protein BD413DRAFT_591206 [Trametes elegans]